MSINKKSFLDDIAKGLGTRSDGSVDFGKMDVRPARMPRYNAPKQKFNGMEVLPAKMPVYRMPLQKFRGMDVRPAKMPMKKI